MYAKLSRINRQCINLAWDYHHHPCNKVNIINQNRWDGTKVDRTMYQIQIQYCLFFLFTKKSAGIQTAPQPYYQPSQFGGMSAIPSPPAVLYNSTPMPSQYGHYERYIASAHYGTAGNTGKLLSPKRKEKTIKKMPSIQNIDFPLSVQPHTMHRTCKVGPICKRPQLPICIKTWHHNTAWVVLWTNHRTINSNSWIIRAPYSFRHHRTL